MRRRILLALTLVVGVIVFPSSASATVDLLDFQSAVDEMLAVDPTLDPPPNDGKHDFVVGGFQAGTYNNAISAHSDPSGQDVFGFETNTARNGGDKYRSRVTCLAVAGNVAAYGVVVTHSQSNTLPPGTQFVDVVRDSGLPGGAGDGWNTFEVPAEDCSLWIPLASGAPPIERGNIVVNDEQP